MLHDHVDEKNDSANRLWAVVLLVALVVGLASVFIWGPDNRVEEVAESVIDHVTGVDIDLSEGEENGTN